jgi:chorismate synthase
MGTPIGFTIVNTNQKSKDYKLTLETCNVGIKIKTSKKKHGGQESRAVAYASKSLRINEDTKKMVLTNKDRTFQLWKRPWGDIVRRTTCL